MRRGSPGTSRRSSATGCGSRPSARPPRRRSAIQRRSLALEPPARDHDLDSALAEADRLLAEANAELVALRAASQARGEEAAAIRRAEAARHAEAETARSAAGRGDAPADRRSRGRRRSPTVGEPSWKVGPRRRGRPGPPPSRTPRTPHVQREAARAAAAEASASPASDGGRRGRRHRWAVRASRLDPRPWTLGSARRRSGGSPGPPAGAVDGGSMTSFVVDPALRAAVEAALEEHARAYLVDIRGRRRAAG